jgi:hypothetical protein
VAGDILERLAADAIRLGADALEVEYKDHSEWVFAEKGPLGFGIASFPSSSPEATELRSECYRVARLKRPHRISVDGCQYELRCAVYDSFGEDAYRIALQPTPSQPASVRARPARRRARRT